MFGTETRTRVTLRETMDAALAERQRANKAVAVAEGAVSEAERKARGEDTLARREALYERPRLRAELERLQIEAARATRAHEEATQAWKAEREAHYRPLIAAEVKRFDGALEGARQAHAKLAAVCAEARADGGGGAAWHDLLWPEFADSTPSRDARLPCWRSCLRRNGWLT
jgi:hypothetical protein